jgi:hypothetical protein
MGREDLIGNSKKHLIPLYQPAGTGRQPEGTRTPRAEGKRVKPEAGKSSSGKPAAAKPVPAKKPAPVKPAADKSASDKARAGKPAPASRGRPPQVPKHPLSQRRGGGKSR